MKIKPEFSTIYRVDVTIPHDVWIEHGHTADFERHSIKASSLVETSGQNSYADVIEWGEGPTREECQAFADYWTKVIEQWKGAEHAQG